LGTWRDFIDTRAASLLKIVERRFSRRSSELLKTYRETSFEQGLKKGRVCMKLGSMQSASSEYIAP